MNYFRRLFAPYAGWYDGWRTPTGVLASAGLYATLFGVHALLNFDPAFRAFYVLPIWLATRVGGRLSGFLTVLIATTISATLDLDATRAFSDDQFFVGIGIRLVSFSVLMLLFAHIEETLWNNRKLAMQDPLTGLLNRRALTEFGGDLLSRAIAFSQPLMLVMIDCDGFKQLNDRYGHKVGDQVLQLLASVLAEHTRESDLIARTGGDEFVVVLPGADELEAKQVMGRVEHAFERAVAEAGFSSGLSVGVAALSEDCKTMDVLLHSADEQMYRRKEAKKARAYLN